MYFTAEHIVAYEVKQGTLAKNNTYTGIIIRDEALYYSNQAGYINYYAREGDKAGTGNIIYTIDESGKLASQLSDNADGEISLSAEDLSSVRTEIINFAGNFSSSSFPSIYDFKYSINGTVLKLVNMNILSNVEDSISAENGSNIFKVGRSEKPGIVVYSMDGYESLTAESVTPEIFEQTDYEKTIFKTNELVDANEPLYKLIGSEQWSVVIPLEEERAEEFSDRTEIQVQFKKDGTKAKAGFSILRQGGGTFAKLDFSSSMIRFATDRFLDIELLLNIEEGLKIPVTSIAEKEFYTIPIEYVTYGGDSSTGGFLKETYNEDGTTTSEYIEAAIYNSTDTEYYVDMDTFNVGEYIIKPDSTEKYPISKKATLIGVYNINKGYADFKRVNILYENDEYCIVQPNSAYGLSVYDHIVLDASTVQEDQILY